MKYRADIDGLRALAVIAVIINHLPGAIFSSGFLGVDVFFVISGFVVTASLVGKESGNFEQFYGNFLARRIRRLWPALTVCVALTSIVVLALDPFPHASIRTGIASLFGLANINLFNAELDYFAASSKFNAFTHTWSLGVEEQFYIVFPMIFWFFTRRDNSSARPLLCALTIITLVSISLFIFYYSYNQPAAYFLMPMRIWELGLGSLAFLFSTQINGQASHRAAAIVSQLLLIILLGSFLVPQEYAVVTTIVAVAVTASLLILQVETRVQQWLSIAPMVYVGKISYSLYLYHWPIVSLAPLLLPTEWRITGLYVVAMLLLSIVSYHIIESPLRRRSWSNSSWLDITIGLGLSCLVATVIYSALMIRESESSETYATAYPPFFLPLLQSGLPYNPNCVVDGRKRLLKTEKFDLCTFAPKSGRGMPFIWMEGDSHAGHLQGLLYQLHQDLGVGVHLIETPGAPFPASYPGQQFAPRQLIHEQILESAKPGDVIALSRLYFNRVVPPALMSDIGPWVDQVGLLADALEAEGLSLLVFGPTPIFDFEDIRECNVDNLDSCSVSRAALEAKVDEVMGSLYRLVREHDNVFVFDSFSILCPDADSSCYPSNNGLFKYRDKDHLNSFGAKSLTIPFVKFLRDSEILTHGK